MSIPSWDTATAMSSAERRWRTCHRVARCQNWCGLSLSGGGERRHQLFPSLARSQTTPPGPVPVVVGSGERHPRVLEIAGQRERPEPVKCIWQAPTASTSTVRCTARPWRSRAELPDARRHSYTHLSQSRSFVTGWSSAPVVPSEEIKRKRLRQMLSSTLRYALAGTRLPIVTAGLHCRSTQEDRWPRARPAQGLRT
jgi:hypothetical protein